MLEQNRRQLSLLTAGCREANGSLAGSVVPAEVGGRLLLLRCTGQEQNQRGGDCTARSPSPARKSAQCTFRAVDTCAPIASKEGKVWHPQGCLNRAPTTPSKLPLSTTTLSLRIIESEWFVSSMGRVRNLCHRGINVFEAAILCPRQSDPACSSSLRAFCSACRAAFISAGTS